MYNCTCILQFQSIMATSSPLIPLAFVFETIKTCFVNFLRLHINVKNYSLINDCYSQDFGAKVLRETRKLTHDWLKQQTNENCSQQSKNYKKNLRRQSLLPASAYLKAKLSCEQKEKFSSCIKIDTSLDRQNCWSNIFYEKDWRRSQYLPEQQDEKNRETKSHTGVHLERWN